MRLAYLVNQYPKVSHSFIRREIQALERLGIEVVRIALRGWDAELADPADIAERKATRYVLYRAAPALPLALARVALTSPRAFFRGVASTWRLSRTADRPLMAHLAYLAEACRVALWLRREGVKHLHAHFGTNSATVAMLARVLGGPEWSFTVHGPEEFDRAASIALADKISRCAFVVAISSYGRSQLYRHAAHADWPKIHVVHCGLEPSFHSVPARPPVSARRLACVGRLCEQKGQLLLVAAAARLAEKGIDCELVLAGDGEMRAEIEALAARLGLGAKVRITGWISGEEVREEILAARALVLPSFAEGLPVVIMEAMALRRPVVSTYVAGIPELVRDGEHGWLVPAGDVEALSDAMRVCLEASSDALARMGEAARERVLTRHHIDVEAARLARLFERTAGDGSARPETQ